VADETGILFQQFLVQTDCTISWLFVGDAEPVCRRVDYILLNDRHSLDEKEKADEMHMGDDTY
jgi:hypothetical protein